MQEVVLEILLDHVPLVAGADDEFVNPMGGVDFHHVPEDRVTADLDHRFWPQVGFFTQARTEPAG